MRLGGLETSDTVPLGVIPDVFAAIDPATVDWSRVSRGEFVIHQRITYRYAGPVHRLRQRLVVQPRETHGDQRRLSRRVHVVDAEPRSIRGRLDDFGNHVLEIDIPYVAEQVSFISSSVVERSVDTLHIQAGALLRDRRLLEPTGLTTPDRALLDLAADLRTTGLQGQGLAAAVCMRVHELMRYEHDVTGVRTTAAEAFALGAGVCQDYAHIMLAVTRALGLASRYVSGQLLGVGGSHAWVEVLLPDGHGNALVLSLDPTHGRATDLTYLTIALGRDYAHVAPVSGTYAASHHGHLTIAKRVAVMRVDEAA